MVGERVTLMIDAIQRNVAWRAIPIAGIAGGTAFLLIVILLSSAWLGVDSAMLLSYFASLVMGNGVLTNPSVLTLIVGIGVHYVLSIAFALIIALVVHRWGLWVGIVGGAILGLSLYAINLYTMTLIFPWFYAINSTLLVVGHVLYGAVVGAVYEMMDSFDEGLNVEEDVHAAA
jgi:hypothetical protein